ncbi:hypothetical protein KA078_04015 [Candidatus Woesebacteria bacterium]|nr:hypothetical protein [Candidatus Woesebacteria bacterium]
MRHAVRNFFRQHSRLLILGGAVLLYLIITLPAFFAEQHTFKNLEPYPDGLYYALGGKALADSNSFELRYRDASLVPQVPVVYPFLLSVGYRVMPTVESFYLVNILLGAGTLVLLWLVLQRLTEHLSFVVFGMGVFVSNAVFWFLPTLPMTENLSLFFFTLAVYGLLMKRMRLVDVACAVGGIAGLVYTHHSAVSVAGVLAVWLIYTVIAGMPKIISKRALWAGLAVGVVGVAVASKPLAERIMSVWQQLLNPENIFFNLKYVIGNIRTYSAISAGFSQFFLWVQTPLISPVVGVLSIMGMVMGLMQKKGRKIMLFLTSLFVSQFPPLLVFYVVDERYSIYTMVLAVLLSVVFLSRRVPQLGHKKLVMGVLLSVCVVSSVISQRALVKQVVAANFLGSSHGWQQEAIQQFDQYFSQADSGGEVPLLITALPPVLVSAYQTAEYRVLPLSSAQEFLQKKEYMWGSDVPYGDLLSGYEQWLEEGKLLYITNAYITHQASVIQDFEDFKNRFTLTQVSEGCINACNVYMVGVK